MNKRSSRAPRFAVTAIECYERPVTLRLPFRFGAATVTEAPQAFVARIDSTATDGTRGAGHDRGADDSEVVRQVARAVATATNIDDLRAALALAATAYCANSAPRTAFGHADVPLSRAAGPRRAREPATR